MGGQDGDESDGKRNHGANKPLALASDTFKVIQTTLGFLQYRGCVLGPLRQAAGHSAAFHRWRVSQAAY